MSRIDTDHASTVCTRPLSRRPEAKDLRAFDFKKLNPDGDRFELTPGDLRADLLCKRELTLAPLPPSQARRCATGAGYATRPGGRRGCDTGRVADSQRACLDQFRELHTRLDDVKCRYGEWRRENPNAPEPTDGELKMSEILERPAHECCVRLICVIIHEHPEVIEEAGVRASEPEHLGIPSNEIGQCAPPSPTAPGQPGAPTAPAAPPPGDFLSQMGQMFGPLASMLGGFLNSPFAMPLLMGACALIPGAQVIIPFLPVAVPLAGMLLSGLGGAATGAPAGAPGAAPDLGALVNGIGGMLDATPTAAAPAAAPAPVPVPVPTA